MTTPSDLIGRSFGRLIVTEPSRAPNGRKAWLCRCSCGAWVTATTSNLTTGNTSSCGCLCKERTSLSNATHRRSRTGTYRAWRAMIQRCENPSQDSYKYYGGRGISVCSLWRSSFEAFLADMNERPTPEHSLDRIDVNGNYEPGNCRWATAKEQRANRRDSRKAAVP